MDRCRVEAVKRSSPAAAGSPPARRARTGSYGEKAAAAIGARRGSARGLVSGRGAPPAPRRPNGRARAAGRARREA